jgi:hypothetical protein
VTQSTESLVVPKHLWDGLQSILHKAFGAEMNGPWSAWATRMLTPEELDALNSVGIFLKPGTTAPLPTWDQDFMNAVVDSRGYHQPSCQCMGCRQW